MAFTHDLVKRFFEDEVMREKNSFRLEDFVAYCVFLGCDYYDRVPGVKKCGLTKTLKRKDSF